MESVFARHGLNTPQRRRFGGDRFDLYRNADNGAQRRGTPANALGHWARGPIAQWNPNDCRIASLIQVRVEAIALTARLDLLNLASFDRPKSALESALLGEQFDRHVLTRLGQHAFHFFFGATSAGRPLADIPG